jgi:isopentenyl-diphosphate delta-isomerase
MIDEPQVILVNEQDEVLGFMGKEQAHLDGKLHRAISILLFNDQKDWLIHQRNPLKYHSGGLWTNTCCSHPAPNESTTDAAHRRLREEMGINTELNPEFSFQYLAKFDNGLTEHELDHVFFGKFNGKPMPDPNEISDWKWISRDQLEFDMQVHPEKYTVWFHLIVDKMIELGK